MSGARLPARSDDAGRLVRLHEQNRQAWDQALIARGLRHLTLSAKGETISVYHLQAGIAACHDTAPDDTSTDWPRILALYDHLVTIDDSPVAAMNRAVALARVKGPAAGLAALKNIRRRGTLESRHLFHAICGTLAAELGDHPQALVHFRQAGDLATLPAERDFIARQVRACENSA